MSIKRKIDDLSEGNAVQNFKIMIVESEVQKSKNYISPPKTLARVPPVAGDNVSWFSFAPKEYYPVGIFDSNNKLVNDPGKLLYYGVISNDTNAKPYEVTGKPMAKGVYWFGVVRAHASEQLTLRFSCEGVEPLVFVIDVIGDHFEEKEEEDKEKGDEEVPPKKLKSRKSDANSLASAASDKIESDSAVEKTTPVAAGSRRASARFVPAPLITVVDDELPLVVDSVAAAVPVSSSFSHQSLLVEQRLEESLVGSTHSDSTHFVESILPMATNITLNSKTRLEPRMGGGVAVVIKGPLFEVRLPLALVRAVLDDKATNAGRVVEYNKEVSTLQEASGSSASGSKAKSALVPVNLRDPTAGQLFKRLEDMAVEKIGGANGHVVGCVDTLRQLFEYFLEDHLLYPAERLAFRTRINLMRSQRLPFADEFGAYHFLRLLVLVISGAEIVGVAGEGSSGVGSSSSSSKGCQQQDSTANSITKYFSAADSNLKGKQNKNVHSKMQEVLDLAVVLLNEEAHVLFY